MEKKLFEDLARLVESFDGLSIKQITDEFVLVSGNISFDAAYQSLERIIGTFELELYIPLDYPSNLPIVKESADRISSDYGHINPDDSFCLAVPLEKKLFYDKSPSLVGFMDNLVIPFLYSYCYWRKYSEMPYDDMKHGTLGLAEYYFDMFESRNPAHTLNTILYCLVNGYSAHVPCACGSGKKTLRCHKFETKLISQTSNKSQIMSDLKDIYDDLVKRKH